MEDFMLGKWIHIGEFQFVEKDPMSTNYVRKLVTFCFFDSVHPTEKAYQQFAELIWSGTPNITSPYNLKALFEH